MQLSIKKILQNFNNNHLTLMLTTHERKTPCTQDDKRQISKKWIKKITKLSFDILKCQISTTMNVKSHAHRMIKDKYQRSGEKIYETIL